MLALLKGPGKASLWPGHQQDFRRGRGVARDCSYQMKEYLQFSQMVITSGEKKNKKIKTKKQLYSTISMAPGGWGANTFSSELCEAKPTKPSTGCLDLGWVENSICRGICCIITVVGFSTGNRRRTLSTEAGSLWTAQVRGKQRWTFWWLGSDPGEGSGTAATMWVSVGSSFSLPESKRHRASHMCQCM